MLKALFDYGGLRLEDLVQINSYVWTLMGDLYKGHESDNIFQMREKVESFLLGGTR
jgi:hypothetical protein